jgi:hypothetical protein
MQVITLCAMKVTVVVSAVMEVEELVALIFDNAVAVLAALLLVPRALAPLVVAAHSASAEPGLVPVGYRLAVPLGQQGRLPDIAVLAVKGLFLDRPAPDRALLLNLLLDNVQLEVEHPIQHTIQLLHLDNTTALIVQSYCLSPFNTVMERKAVRILAEVYKLEDVMARFAENRPVPVLPSRLKFLAEGLLPH